MQDTKNLKKKIKEYEKELHNAKERNDVFYIKHWKEELEWVKFKIDDRKKNKLKNIKQYKKSHGYYKED